MTKIIFHYLHRDEGNLKDHLYAVMDNPNNLPLDEIEKRIKGALIDGVWFTPKPVGLEKSNFADPGDWHEFDSIEDTQCSDVERSIDSQFKVDEFIKILEQARRPLSPMVIHKIPAFVSIRLSVSMLEFIRETRQSLGIILNVCKGKKTVMVFNDGDWEILSETLDLDAQSGNFDNELRKDISRALDRATTIDINPLRTIRWKSRRIEECIQQIVRDKTT